MQARGRGPDRDLTSHNHNRDTPTLHSRSPFHHNIPWKRSVLHETTHNLGGPGSGILLVAAVALGSHGSDGRDLRLCRFRIFTRAGVYS